MIVGFITDSQNIGARLFQVQAEPKVMGRKVGGQKYNVH